MYFEAVLPYVSMALPNTPSHTLELPSYHALLDSLTFFATWKPNQVIEKTMLCPTQSLPFLETALSSSLLQPHTSLL